MGRIDLHVGQKSDPEACLIHCNKDEQHVINKLIEIFRNDDESHKEALTHNINLFCGDKLWVRMGSRRDVKDLTHVLEWPRGGQWYLFVRIKSGLNFLKVIY